MAGIDFYIYIVISLLGIAYPLLLQVIARLDEKYSSDNIVSIFDLELEGKVFRYSLILSLGFILIWTLKLEPLIQIDGLNFLIDNSAAILVALSTIALVIAFFFFVRKILIYYTPTKFIQYMRLKHTSSNKDFKYFEGLSDILLLSIKKQQTNLAITISDFFYTAFRIEREKNHNKPVVYPDMYYEVVHKSIEELAILKEKRNYSLEYRTAGGIWLLGELQGNEISEKTYSWMWRNLLLITQYKQDDMILYHWETAHQFYTYSLQQILADYDYTTGNLQVSNLENVEKRKKDRQRFVEFHYALGGLLLYKNMYDCIKRIHSHTNSQPPKYELLPESMHEIFKFFFAVRDPYDNKYTWISHTYPFPKQSGLNADGVIKRWISSYMALLLLRQYTLVSYLTTIRPLDFPPIPQTQEEIKEWIDGIDFLKTLVLEHLNNQDLLKQVNLTFLTPDWCTENGEVYPTDFIDRFKEQLQEAYHINALTLPLSEDKILQFETSTRQIIEDTLNNYSALNNTNSLDGESDKWYINGQRMIQSKDAFTENSEVHHMHFDSFLASSLSDRIRNGITSTFQFKNSKTFLFKSTDVFPAIDRLNIDDQFLIVCFGIDLDYFINHIKVSQLTTEKYHDTPILNFNSSRSIDPSLFILRKIDLPKISIKAISQDIINKYSLKKISEKINLYASVIDLNSTTVEIFEENRQGKEDDELRKSVLLSIILSTEIKWKKSTEVIQILQHSDYSQKGIANSLKEVEPIGKQKPN